MSLAHWWISLGRARSLAAWRVAGRALIAVSALGCTALSLAQSSPSAGSGAAQSKAIVLDAVSPPVVQPWADAAAATTLMDLGLALLQGSARSATPGAVAPNELGSPLAVGTLLSLLHRGAAGPTAGELNALVEPAVAQGQFYRSRLPGLVSTLARSDPAALTMASRIWVRADVLGAVPAGFMTQEPGRFSADLALFPPGSAEISRMTLNAWVAERTRGGIAQLFGAGSLTPTTRIALVSAVHFRSRWERPFDPRLTVAQPFATPAGPRPVVTMIGEASVRRGLLDRLEVFEIPFADGAFVLLLAMSAADEPLAVTERRLGGAEWMSWKSRLPGAAACRLHLPRLRLAAPARSLKPDLAGLGVTTLFGAQADLSPMLGAAAAGTYVDDLIQGASLTLDELGGEASAAAGATVQAKSMPATLPDCRVNRPFLFAVMHTASGAPVLVGRISDPAMAQAAR